MAIFFKRNETIEEKKDRLLGTYPHNTWCPECLKRMIDSKAAVLLKDQLFCSSACCKTYITTTKKPKSKKNDKTGIL